MGIGPYAKFDILCVGRDVHIAPQSAVPGGTQVPYNVQFLDIPLPAAGRQDAAPYTVGEARYSLFTIH